MEIFQNASKIASRYVATLVLAAQLALSSCVSNESPVLQNTPIPSPTNITQTLPDTYNISLLTCAFANIDPYNQDYLNRGYTQMLGDKNSRPSVVNFYHQYGITVAIDELNSEWLTIGSDKSYKPPGERDAMVNFDDVTRDCLSAYGRRVNPEDKSTITIIHVNGYLGGKSRGMSRENVVLIGSSANMFLIAHELGHSMGLGHVGLQNDKGEILMYEAATDTMSAGHRLYDRHDLYTLTRGIIPSNFSIPSLYRLQKTNTSEFANLKDMKQGEDSSIAITDLYAKYITQETKRGIILQTSTGDMVSIELRLENDNPNSYDSYAVEGVLRDKNNPAVIISMFSLDPNNLDSTILFNPSNPDAGNWFEPGDMIYITTSNETYMIYVTRNGDELIINIIRTA